MPNNCQATALRRFEFERDSFAFENETFWEYHFDDVSGKTTFGRREPKPAYGHRCFVLTRAARQFFYHARFNASQIAPDDPTCRRLICEVVARNPRQPCLPDQQIVIPGYASLREFSAARASLLKTECGGAWRSYILRSHWRMVFPISRAHQARTAASLFAALKRNVPPIIHLVKIPSLTINHSMILFDAAVTVRGIDFQACDPNNTKKPATLSFDHKTRTFSLPRNHYWAGGVLDIIEIYRSWLM
ncbi:MAG: hypothetical protein ABSA83_20710 [Verrucomicrobiota bacterium]|jgi:hypothetical protein